MLSPRSSQGHAAGWPCRPRQASDLSSARKGAWLTEPACRILASDPSCVAIMQQRAFTGLGCYRSLIGAFAVVVGEDLQTQHFRLQLWIRQTRVPPGSVHPRTRGNRHKGQGEGGFLQPRRE
jgi:hypothetical protein